LRDRYERAQRVLSNLTGGVEQLASSASAGQRGGGPPGAAGRPETRSAGSTTARLEVRSQDLERVLDFQEALALVEGVERISIVGTTEDGAHLIVQLTSEKEPELDAGDEPTLVCAWCGRLIAAGSEEISHGLCADCAAKVFERRGPDQ
jgi:hypothetical protein